MKPYLLASSGLHAAILTAAFFMIGNGGLRKPQDVYKIDFLSPAAGARAVPAAVEPAKAEAPAKAPAKAAVQKRRYAPPPDELETPTKTKPKRPLMRPSVLSEPAPTAPVSSKAAAPPVPKTASAAPAAAPAAKAGPSGADVTADFPNFPYPWYITQLRQALWNQWTQVMPRGGSLGCVVRFAIDRSGQPSAVEVEQTSGNSLYDYAAVSAVRGAAPFPPLPDQFRDGALKVHVQFRTAP